MPRWNGPATVVDLTAIPDGIIGVRWQGRNLQIRVQDCRRALAFMFGRNPMNANPVAKLADFDLCTEPTREPTREWCHGGWDSLTGDWFTRSAKMLQFRRCRDRNAK